MDSAIPYLGETTSLSTALIWATAVILFKKSGETVHPIALNLFKNLLAAVLFIPTIWLLGKTLARQVPAEEYLLMLASGAIGIGLADTLFFKSLNLLGASLSAIVDCLYSPFIIGLSILWIGEEITTLQLIGVVMIVSAVLAVTRGGEKVRITPRDLRWGIAFGVLSMALMAVGIVMIKPLLNRSPLLWSVEIRLVGGCLVLGLVLLFHPARVRIMQSLGSAGGRGYTLAGSFIGAYMAMVLWLAGMKFTQASVASALNQTSNIFVFIFAAILLKEAINLRRIIGITLAVSGAFLVTFGDKWQWAH